MTGSAKVQQAYKAFQAGNFAQCLNALGPVLEADTLDQAALLIAAQCHVKLGNGEAAATLYARLADLQPSNRDRFLKLAAESAATGVREGMRDADILPTTIVEQMLAARPAHEPALQNLITLYRKETYRQATDDFDALVASGSITDLPVAIVAMISDCHEKLGNIEKAAHYRAVAGLQPSPHQARLLNAALPLFRKLLLEKGALPDVAYEAAKRLVSLEPRNLDASSYYRYAMHTTCAIEDLRAYNAHALKGLENSDAFLRTNEVLHSHLCWCADERLNAQIQNTALRTKFTAASRQARRQRPHQPAKKIRIGYLTADLYAEHPTTLLFKGVLAAHDLERFDVTLYCYTPDKFSDADRAFRKTLPNLVTITHMSDEEAAQRIRARGTDILIDLKGPTSDARSDILNIGAAPIQAAWLGFPGSGTGIDCDYVISDRIVTPDSSKPFYHEKFCRLPESYQCNDGFARPLPPPMSKTELGIAEDTFLFASFNSMNKLSPQIIDLWAEVLQKVVGSKLALFNNHEKQKQNFLSAMALKGLGPDRFHFLPRAGYRDHLARIPAADLGLDCYPYNGHTTTSDMLWMGLPLLTFKGSNFASRVSESLLRAADMEELITENASAFVEKAVALSQQPETLQALRNKIIANRFRAPLFDTERFTRHLERGFEMMLERFQAGQEPDHFDVPPLPAHDAPFR
ncbi:hypothetical protein [Rhizobium sp. L1K21]|uniref:O-linked N-acetylglucosamine transferase, SPINDLY family protein n=1 Tax=Rhizobium sp. L1K21 TaxID=2954933 RepID=UPI002093C92F|nr:hypothetical protein [Rhizobium sp. L1K21]MCO6185573.1 hypothetical protein [Rhizobium sp. L1K21]